MQSILILILFIVAIGYIARILYNSFTAKHSCASACGKCGTIDFKKIEAKVTADLAAKKNILS